MVIWLASLLGILLCIQPFLFGGKAVATSGLIHFALAGILLGWSAIAFRTRRKAEAEHGNACIELMRIPRVAETLLVVSYIFAATSWLNILSGIADLPISIIVSVLTMVLCFGLFFQLVHFQDQATGVMRDRKGRKRAKATVAWVLLMATLALPLVAGVARSSSIGVPELSAPEISLAWLCFCSVFLAAVLFRPLTMNIRPKIATLATIIIVGLIGISAALEQTWRRDWYLFTLTLLIFLGTSLGTWRLIGSLYMAGSGSVAAGAGRSPVPG